MLCVGIRCRQLAIRLAPSRRLEFTTPFRNFSFATRAMATDAAPETMFALDPFCLRQFDNPSNVAFIDMKPEEFMSKLDAACKAQAAQAPDGNILCVFVHAVVVNCATTMLHAVLHLLAS
eukprot:INCI13430.19.p2 GENE.INCI13430.19~~INCI13430.19.p2  ORF type:complete len:120 (+),score=19.64 INCI13430.19:299-658(+)